MKSIITYKIINLVNQHFYIGSTFRPTHREIRHFKDLRKGNHHCIRLQRAFNKHGETNFKFEVISDSNIEQELLNEHHGKRYCYNTAKDVAANMLGYKFSKASRLKLSKLNKGRKHTQEAKDKISKSNKGRKRTEEQNKVNSLLRTGVVMSDETKQKIREKLLLKSKDSEYQTNVKNGLLKHWSTVDKTKFCNTMQNMWDNLDEETKLLRNEKISKAQIGKKHSPERIKNMMEGKRKAKLLRDMNL
jgi:group I intron endonuclease